MKARLDEVRANTASICDDLDSEFASTAPAPSFATVFRRYPLWDMFLLPIDDLSDAGERDLVRFIRISPEAASYIRKPAEDKLAGDTLSHFGAFAWRAWRQNDILWGRLDAAEVLARVVLAGQPADKVTAAIRSVQQQIAAEELPDMKGDYKAHLENEYRVGSEGLDVIPAKDRVAFVMDASTVTRNLMRRLGDARLATGVPVLFHWLGVGLGFALTVFRWPVRRRLGQGHACEPPRDAGRPVPGGMGDPLRGARRLLRRGGRRQALLGPRRHRPRDLRRLGRAANLALAQARPIAASSRA